MESNKDYSHLLERIKGLDTTIIEEMSPDVMANLTDGFKEQLVREMLYTTHINYEQRTIIKAVKAAYKNWKRSTDRYWGDLPLFPEKYPQYMEELQMDIECGCVVTAEGLSYVSNSSICAVPASFLRGFYEACPKEQFDAIFERDDSSEHNSPLRKDKKKLQKDDEISKLLAEKDAIIKEQEERIADYAAKFDPQDINKKKFAAMTGKQHAIFLLAVLAHNDRLPHARTNLSFLLSFIASRNETTMCDYLKERFTQDECETLAKVFDTDCPFIAEMIRELPEKLEKDKSEKNRAKALKNNNA